MDDNRALLAVLVLVALAYALPQLSSVFVPFLVAVLLALALYPAIVRLQARGVPYGVGATLAILFLLAFAVAIGWAVEAGIEHFVDRLPEFGPKIDAWWSKIRPADGEAATALARYLAEVAGSILEFAFQLVLVFVYLIFLLVLRPRLGSMLEAAGGPAWRERGLRLAGAMEEQMRRYLGLTTVVSLASAVFTWVLLTAYGIEEATLWAALAFLGHFVPYVGPVVAMVPPALMALIQTGSWLEVLEVSIWLASFNTFLGYYVAPRVFGRGLGLNEVVVLLGLALGSWMWGVVGAMVSVPLLVLIRIALRETELRATAELMGPFPAKPP